MIEFYTGVPGSGKSYHVARRIYSALQHGINVLSNVDIDVGAIPQLGNKKKGIFIYLNADNFKVNRMFKTKYGRRVAQNEKFSYIQGLYGFAFNFHTQNSFGAIKEGQTLLVLDECQQDYLFNSRSWNRKDRLAWINFFRIHRHLGYNCILISQDDKSIDKQIRPVLQKQVLHRKLSNYKKLGKILSAPFGGNVFICIESMYGMKKSDAHLKSYVLFGSPKYFAIYNSYEIL